MVHFPPITRYNLPQVLCKGESYPEREEEDFVESKTPYQILELAQKLQEGFPSRRYKVRAILKWFGASRRGKSIAKVIEDILMENGLTTEPDLKDVEIDDHVVFSKASIQRFQITLPTPNPKDIEELEEKTIIASVPVSEENLVEHPMVISRASEDEFEPEVDDDEEQEIKSDDHPVSSDSRDWTILSLQDKVNRGQLILQPEYQREYVWKLKPELPSRLIESLLLQIPIPPIYFGKVIGGHMEIIDGQQRLTTLLNFVANKFPLQKLRGMNSLNGKMFKDLPQQHQEKILDSPIRSIVIDAAKNMELRYEIFERLNRGSMQLNEQEIRNCVSRGPFNDLLMELEKDPIWRKVKGGTDPEGRFKEREMILRFFAFANRLQQYTGSLKRFLNEYMGPYAPKEPQDIKNHINLFKQTVQNIYAVFGKESARLYEITPESNDGSWDKKFSVTAFDMQAAALMNRSTAKVQQASEQIRELFIYTMLTDTELRDAISKRTGSTSQTRIRWSRFRELTDPIINGTVVEPRFYSYQFREGLWKKSHVCLLCKNEIHDFDDSTVDHVLAWVRGGRTTAGNGQLAHRSCNARKNAKLLIEDMTDATAI
jgi:5-methylcytosine-specific restriction endonuclease McrA